MQLHELQSKNKRQDKKRVGRGGKRGKTSGKGHKGQKARAGGTPRPELRDLIKKIPKLRGHGKNRAKTVHSGRMKVAHVSLDALSASFKDSEVVTPLSLVKKGVVERVGKRIPPVKILANGTLSRKVEVRGCNVSKKAKEAIEKAGGVVKG